MPSPEPRLEVEVSQGPPQPGQAQAWERLWTELIKKGGPQGGFPGAAEGEVDEHPRLKQ